MTTDFQQQRTELDAQQQQILDSNPTENQYSDIEQRARSAGWRPKEEFDGDATHEWVDAGEFLRRGELIDKIKTLSKKNKETERTMQMLVGHYNKVRENEFQRAITFLKSQRKEALVAGDVDKVFQLEDQERQVAEKFQEFKQETKEATQAGTNELDPSFISFTKRNAWYQSDKEATADADAIGIRYRAEHPDADYEDLLKYVEGRVRKLHPQLFKANRPSAVDGSSASGTGSKGKLDDSFLTADERRAMDAFVRKGIVTKEKYLEDIKRLRG
jgi:hypothetical protein